jgi:hypothetical protein
VTLAARERGSALVVILIVSLMIGAVAVGVWSLSHVRLVSAGRRAWLARAESVASSAVLVAAGWLEAADRRVVMEPPDLALIDRDRRRPDPDGDGRGDLWSESDPPHDVRFKEGASEMEEVFGAPNGPDARDAFLGTWEGPDLVVERGSGGAEEYLGRMSRLLDPTGLVQVERIAFSRAPPAAGEAALASIEVLCGARLPGGVPMRVRARADVHEVRWGAARRPLVVERGATFSGDARWEWGEALIGGDLSAPEATWELWPSGVPWADETRPMRRDNDGDGTADDRDGDGTSDWEAWRDLPDPVPDPWWGARVSGAWPQVAPDPGVCDPAFPFGPWDDPPADPVKDGERSGIRLACPSGEPIVALREEWRRLARRGPRGIARYVEDPDREGWFRLNGRGDARPVDELVPAEGGVVWLELHAERSDPLRQTFSAAQGGVLVAGGDLLVEGGTRRERSRVRAGDPRERRGSHRGAYLRALMDDTAGRAWNVEDWFEEGDGPGAQGPSEVGEEPVHFHGVLAADGVVEVRDEYHHAGAIRAGELILEAGSEQIRMWASYPSRSTARWGPPEAPRVRVENLRIVR